VRARPPGPRDRYLIVCLEASVMNTMEYGAVRAVDRTRALFGQVMWYVAATAGLFALGA
jgi:hypothetical protein